ALRQCLHGTEVPLALAVLRHAPALVTTTQRTEVLVRALKVVKPYHGLTEALHEVQAFHPPEVIEALLRGCLTRTGEAAVHYAALLLFLHGHAASPFDWDQRPFFLRFNAGDPRERERAFVELCAKIVIEAAPYLSA
ncbi:MAG TPA: hypothetical protein VHF69_02405, partial [Candidatus Synoicihabitans sp.]|nr:hypothetical protein [Candidatus Synoicihabitans sp.]